MTDENAISVARALTELKMLSKRITRTGEDAIFVSGVRGTEKVSMHNMTLEETDKAIKGGHQSILALIERRNAIKVAIVNSNAVTNVEVAGVKYTVAGAIERKTSIDFDKELLANMKAKFANVMANVDKHNAQVDKEVQMLFGKTLSNEETNKEAIETAMVAYKNQHMTKLFDPIGVRKKMSEIATNIEEFEAEVDTVLTESNATTFITIG